MTNLPDLLLEPVVRAALTEDLTPWGDVTGRAVIRVPSVSTKLAIGTLLHSSSPLLRRSRRMSARMGESGIPTIDGGG